MTLWLTIGAATLLALLWLVRPLVGGGGRAVTAADARAVYRDQLRDVERDLARGLLGPSEAEGVRAEIGRRLLAADDLNRAAPAAGRAPPGASRGLAIVLALVLGLGATGLYLERGAPDLQDRPLAARTDLRPGQAQAERMLREAGVPAAPAVAPDQEPLAALVGQLAERLAAAPADLRGHRLHAGALARLGRFAEAHAAQARVIALAGAQATAADEADLAEYMILAANGYVSPEAEAALARALEREPANPQARFYAGLALAQAGENEAAWRIWTAMIAEGPPDAPWIPAVRERLAPVAAALGRPLPVTPANPAAPDNGALVRDMVEGLASRLAAEGGPAEDWARLVRSLGVLGETGRARAVLAEARTVFAADPVALALLRSEAQAGGVEP
jgi:cytochrome c-type biogenesis protein CcmH